MELPAGSKPLATLSPSRLVRLACPARISFEQARKQRGKADQQSSMKALMGSVVHLALERAIVGVDLRVAWEQACEELKKPDRDPLAYPGSEQVFGRLRRRWKDLQEILAADEYEELLIEQRMESEDGALEGTPDLVIVRKNSFVVVDYKTGVVHGDSGPKLEYERQLRIYAGLAAGELDRHPERAILLSMKQGVVDVSIEAVEIARELELAKVSMEAYNQRAPGPQPANPTEDVCRWCHWRARCPAFWGAVGEHWVSGDWEHAVLGQVERVENARAGVSALRLIPLAGTLETGERVIVSSIPTDRVAALSVGETVGLTALRRRRELGFAWTRDSLVATS